MKALRPMLVGEDNPWGTDPRFALYPEPEYSAGGRLCHKILGLSKKEYIKTFERRNLCRERWSIREARDAADAIKRERLWSEVPIVLLGAKVCEAFAVDFEPFTVSERFGTRVEAASIQFHCLAHCYVVLPHPSGRSRAWNESGSFERVRDVLRLVGALPLLQGGTLHGGAL